MSVEYRATPITLPDKTTHYPQCDANGVTKVYINNTTTSPAPVKIGDGTNLVTLDTSGADATSNTSNRFPVVSWLKGFNGTTWDRLRSGLSGVQTALTGMLNSIPMGQYNTAGATLADGNVAPIQLDAKGAVKVNTGFYNATPAETAVSVALTSTQLVASNTNRSRIIIQNQDATNPIYIALDSGAAATDGTCYKLVAGAPPLDLKDGAIPNGAIFAIATGAPVTTYVAEFS